uniref:Short-chain dehydrogenease/reductase-like protein n=1 Tax=Steinernema glaseri TaxID=37863 RepID=A0A1I7ZMV5_9BILA
ETENQLVENGVSSDRFLVVQGDIEDPETAKKLLEDTVAKFGKIDVLVNNAGVGAKPTIDPNSEENLDFVLDVNLKSVIRLNNLVIPELEKTKGNIVNISSIDALQAHQEYSYYAISKSALDHYMRHMAPPLGRKGVRINNVNPGLVPTNLVKRMGVDNATFDQLVDDFVAKDVPLGRTGTPGDIAQAVSYLASSEASYVTGTTLVVDGGALVNYK